MAGFLRSAHGAGPDWPRSKTVEAEMAVMMWCRLRELISDMTCAVPGRRVDPESRDWMPPMIAGADLASPYFLAMADRDAGWYQERQRSF